MCPHNTQKLPPPSLGRGFLEQVQDFWRISWSGRQAEDKLWCRGTQSQRHRAGQHEASRIKSPHTATMLVARIILLLVLLLTSSLHWTTGYSTPTECCFNYAQKPIRHMRGYYETPGDCSMPAVVLVAANGAQVCADPKKPWVQKALKRLQRRK